ncbi:MAG: hypothetical protein ACOX7P_05450 [Oscillospiraceae bacterium]
MKKAFSIILVFMLIFSLAAMVGCKKGNETAPTEPPAATKAPVEVPATEAPKVTLAPATELEDSNASAENIVPPVTKYYGKSVPELIEEGISPLVGITMPVLSDPHLLEIIDALEAHLQEDGLQTEALEAKGDIPTQIMQVENFVTMGCVAIVEGAMSIEALVTCNEAAVEAGVVVTSLGNKPTNHEISGGIFNDMRSLGLAEGDMIIAYLDYAHPDAEPGSIHTAWCKNSNLDNTLLCSNACKEKLLSDPRIKITFEKDLVMEIDTGYTFAEEALTADPEITLFAMYMDASAIGANNYLTSLPNVDLSKYAIFNTSGGEDWRKLLEMSKTNESAIRGSISYGGSDPSQSMYITTHDMLFGLHAIPYWVNEPHWSENSFGWQYSGV